MNTARREPIPAHCLIKKGRDRLKDKESKTVSFWLRPDLDEGLKTRGGNRSQTINRDLERLYTLYKRALREVVLSVPEAWLLVDVLNGTIHDANSAPLLWGSVEDGCNLDGLDGKWEIDGKALVEKLRNLSSIQALALIDAAERFWEAPDGERNEELLRKVFMLR